MEKMEDIRIGSKTLFPHQVRAVQWMLEREDDVEDLPGGFLCDTMGMGKTWSALGLIQESDLRRTLLLCPLAVVEQWAAAGVEAGFNVWTYPRAGVWSARNAVKPGRKRLYVANYERIKENESEDAAFDRLLLDEAHVLRTGSGSRYKKIYGLAKRIPRVWCLTGTPLVNHYRDIQALYQLLRGHRTAGVVPNFNTALEVMGRYGLHRSALTLPAEEVEGLGLGPAPEEVKLVLPFETDAEAEFYRMIQGQIQRQLELFEDLDIANSTAVFKLLLRLRQISIHPQVYIEGQRRSHGGAYGRRNWVDAQGRLKSSTKVSAFLGLLKSQKVAHNWVVFCNFQDEIRILEDMLRREACVGLVGTYHGKKKTDERLEALQENAEACARNFTVPRFLVDKLPLPDDVCGIIHSFVEPKQNVFLVQIHAGGTGLNLQHNDRVVFMGPWWTAALMNQAVARVYRMGQRKEVKVYRLLLEEEQSLNIDRFMMDRAELKEELCAELLGACAHD
jgi:SNF2 family DNA or RNA helicase